MFHKKVEERLHACIPQATDRVGQCLRVWVRGSLICYGVGDVGCLIYGGQSAHIPFGNHDLATGGSESQYAFFEVLKVRIVDAHVSLHADCIDTQAALFQFVYHADYGFSASAHIHAVIIVVELGIRVGFVGILEGQWNVFLAEYLVKGSIPIGAVFQDSFVHHIPTFDSSAITAYDGSDVVFHALLQHFGRNGLSLFVNAKPGC